MKKIYWNSPKLTTIGRCYMNDENEFEIVFGDEIEKIYDNNGVLRQEVPWVEIKEKINKIDI